MCFQKLPVRTGLGGSQPHSLQRDQSEDRPQPKYLIQYRELVDHPWEVIRAADRSVVSRYSTAGEAVAAAVALEEN